MNCLMAAHEGCDLSKGVVGASVVVVASLSKVKDGGGAGGGSSTEHRSSSRILSILTSAA